MELVEEMISTEVVQGFTPQTSVLTSQKKLLHHTAETAMTHIQSKQKGMEQVTRSIHGVEEETKRGIVTIVRMTNLTAVKVLKSMQDVPGSLLLDQHHQQCEITLTLP